LADRSASFALDIPHDVSDSRLLNGHINKIDQQHGLCYVLVYALALVDVMGDPLAYNVGKWIVRDKVLAVGVKGVGSSIEALARAVVQKQPETAVMTHAG
jgi:hypothetical protein